MTRLSYQVHQLSAANININGGWTE